MSGISSDFGPRGAEGGHVETEVWEREGGGGEGKGGGTKIEGEEGQPEREGREESRKK